MSNVTEKGVADRIRLWENRSEQADSKRPARIPPDGAFMRFAYFAVTAPQAL